MESRIKKLEKAFNPHIVAVIGDNRKRGYMWLRNLSTFKGKVYSVQTNPDEFEGIKALGVENYTSLLDIPDPIDYVIVSVPRAAAPEVVRDCIQKGVGGVTLFTSGFAETGTEEGIKFQQEITELARQGGLNLIGPNCMGIFNPKIGLRHSPDQYSGDHGPVGFIAQSGTQASLFSTVGAVNGVKVSKSVSYGNAVVLDSSDYLEYLGQDEETKIIGMYIEGVKDGRRFFSCLQEVACKKPVLIWKGGETTEGARAAASHTGVLAESSNVWEALIKQCGAIKVESLDEMIDVIKAWLYIKPFMGNRIGLIAMSGGQSVIIADTFSKVGLITPSLTKNSYEKLSSFFNIIGGSYRNPLDISTTIFTAKNFAEALQNLEQMLDILLEDDNIDLMVLELLPMFIAQRWPSSSLGSLFDCLSDFKNKSAKPFSVVITPAHREDLANEFRDRLQEKGIANFPSLERGARALGKIRDYFRFHTSVRQG